MSPPRSTCDIPLAISNEAGLLASSHAFSDLECFPPEAKLPVEGSLAGCGPRAKSATPRPSISQGSELTDLPPMTPQTGHCATTISEIYFGICSMLRNLSESIEICLWRLLEQAKVNQQCRR